MLPAGAVDGSVLRHLAAQIGDQWRHPGIPLSLIFKECRTYRIVNFGLQQQSCGVNELQPLQVLESVSWRLEIKS
jgi:hypothetical protein